MPGNSIGQAYVQIIASADGIKGSVERVLNPEVTRAGQAAGRKISGAIGAQMQNVGKGMMKAGAIATAVSVPIIAGIKKSMDAYKIQSAAETKLTEIYKTRMGVSDKAAKKTMELASALQKQGIIGDEVALSGSQQLATFAKYPGTINTLMPAMENLLAQQKGVNATAEDATNIGNLMGKVLQGQTGALKRVGISFDEGQEKVLKYGTEQEKAAMLAKVITDNVGNMNKTMAQTPEGKIQQMKNALGDLTEQLGAALAPALASVANFISANIIPKVETFLSFLQGHPIIGKIVIGITGLLAVGGPLLILLGTIISSVGALIPVVTAISAPVAGIIAGVVGATAAIGLLYAKSETFRNMLTQLVEVIRGYALAAFNELKPSVVKLGKAVMGLWKTIAPYLLPALKQAAAVAPKVLSAFLSLMSGAIKPIRGAFRLATSAVKLMSTALRHALSVGKTVGSGLAGVVKTVISAFGKVYHAVADPFTKAYDKVKGVIDKVKGFFPLKLGHALSFSTPNIDVKGKFPYGLGGKGTKPSFSVSWSEHAAGGIFDRPTLLQDYNGGNHLVGEAGPEAILPLNPLWRKLDLIAEARGNVNNVWNITVDGAEDPEQFAQRLVGRLKLEMRTV